MNLNEYPFTVIDLLVKFSRLLIDVNFFNVTSIATETSCHIPPITPSPAGKINPLGKISLVLFSICHLFPKLSVNYTCHVVFSTIAHFDFRNGLF